MRALKFFLALFLAVMLASCGGGSDSAATPESVTSALRAQAGALSAPSPTDAANQLMNFAEQTFPFLFAPGPTTQSAGPFVYRFYPAAGVYLGVVVVDGTPFLLNHVYLVGGPFGTLAAPTDVGPLTNFITPVDVGPTTKNLVVTVNLGSFGTFGPYALGLTAVPSSQSEFCSEVQPGTVFNQAFADAGLVGTLTINSCSFSGSTGTINATVQVTSPIAFALAMTITYSFQ